MKIKYSTFVRGHAILHVALLVRIRPLLIMNTHIYNLYLTTNIIFFHLWIFGCAVQFPISPPQCTKSGLQRRLKIYVGFDSPSIINYLEPLMGDLFTARFANCHFDEMTFQVWEGQNYILKNKVKLLEWNNSI